MAGVITAVLVALAVTLGALSLAMLWEWLGYARRRRIVAQRLERVETEGLTAIPGDSELLRREQELGWAKRLTTRLVHLQELGILLEQASVDWTVQGYVIRSLGFALALGMGTLIVGAHFLVVVCCATAGAFFPYMYIRRKRARRVMAFEDALPEAVDLLGRAIRAGHPLSAGLRMVGDEGREPVAGEFRRVFEEQRFGLSLEDSLLGMADRVPLVDVRIFAAAVLIQREVGGNLAEILDKLSDVIRQRFTLQRQLNVYTAQGRLSGLILALLPVGVGFLMYLLNGEYTLELFRDPRGRFMVGTALCLQVLGYLWIRKVVDVEL